MQIFSSRIGRFGGRFSAPAVVLGALLLAGSAPAQPTGARVTGAAQPVVTDRAPDHNDPSAPRNTDVTFVVSAPVTADPGDVKIHGSMTGRRAISSQGVSGGGMNVFYNPTLDFKPGELVDVMVTSALESGGSPAVPHVYQFTAAAVVGPGTFVPHPTTPNPGVGTSPFGVAVGDVDGDGDLDLLTTNITANTVSVRVNDGTGAFSGTQNVSVGTLPWDLTVGDVDGDGDLDLLTTNIGTNTVSVRVNDGTGAFSGTQDVSVGNGPESVVLGDVDGDGDLDLLCTSSNTNSVSVRVNNGAGTFSGTQNVATGSDTQSMAVGDVDNDGDLDFVATNFQSNTVSVRVNDGAGTFSGTQNVSVGDHPWGVALGDVDGDGDLDLICCNVVSNSVSVRVNDGAGTFSGTQNVSTGTAPRGVALGDVDGDGDLDILTANNDAASVSVRVNDGAGTFSGTQNVSTAAGAHDVAVGDVDGDGDLDILTANQTSNTASVRLNQTPAPAITGITPSGYPGDQITITGTDLTGATAISFNGTPATTFTVNPGGTSITVTVPNGATTGNVTVTTPGGTSNGVTFKVDADLIVSVTTQSVPADSYHSITIVDGGWAVLTGDITVTSSFMVQAGGVLQTRNGGANCFTISGTGSFTLAAGALLRICSPQGISASGPTGNVQVTGPRTFSPHADYLYGSGVNQSSGSGLPSQVNGLYHFDTGTLTLQQAVAVRAQVGLFGPAGNIDLNGHVLTLRSDADTTAFVYNGNTGAILGNTAHVQRYIAPGTAPGLGYRHMSSPVSGSTVGDLATAGFTPVVNPAYNTAPNPLAVTPYPTVLGFDETRAPTSSNFVKGYFSPASLATALLVGRGYSVYMTGGLTPDFVGTLTTGDVTVPGLTKTGNFTGNTQKSGWHLLGNPFPSPLDWDLVSIPAGMSSSVSVYKSTGGQNGLYLTRAGGTGSLTDGLIAMGQGLFVRVTGAGPVNFTFPNAARVVTYLNPPHFRAAPESRPLVRLTIHAVGAPVAETDEATVYFQPEATAGLDERFDGEKPAHNVGVPTLVSLSGTDELAVNGLPEAALTDGLVVPLLVDVPAAGSYELAVGQALNLASTSLALVDNLTGTRYYVLAGQSLVRFTTSQAGEMRGRFALVIGPAEAAAPGLVLYPNPAHGVVRVSGMAAGETVRVFDGLGRVVRRSPLAAQDSQLDLTGLPAGVYVVQAGSQTQRLVVE